MNDNERENKSEVRKEIFKLLLIFITNTNNVLHMSIIIEIRKKKSPTNLLQGISFPVLLRCTWHIVLYKVKVTEKRPDFHIL